MDRQLRDSGGDRESKVILVKGERGEYRSYPEKRYINNLIETIFFLEPLCRSRRKNLGFREEWVRDVRYGTRDTTREGPTPVSHFYLPEPETGTRNRKIDLVLK